MAQFTIQLDAIAAPPPPPLFVNAGPPAAPIFINLPGQQWVFLNAGGANLFRIQDVVTGLFADLDVPPAAGAPVVGNFNPNAQVWQVNPPPGAGLPSTIGIQGAGLFWTPPAAAAGSDIALQAAGAPNQQWLTV